MFLCILVYGCHRNFVEKKCKQITNQLCEKYSQIYYFKYEIYKQF